MWPGLNEGEDATFGLVCNRICFGFGSSFLDEHSFDGGYSSYEGSAELHSLFPLPP